MLTTILLFLPSLLSLSQPLELPSSKQCPSNESLVVTAAFVDIFGGVPATFLATSDGGVALVFRRGDTNGPRVVKLDQNAKVEWINERRADDGSTFELIEALAEDETEGALYLSGTLIRDNFWGRIAKYNISDGTMIRSVATKVEGAENETHINTMLCDNGELVLAGELEDHNPWVGTANRSTLDVTVRHPGFLRSKRMSIMRVILDGDRYVFAGIATASGLWVAAVSRGQWNLQWEFLYDSDGVMISSVKLSVISPGNYGVLSDIMYIALNSTSIVSTTYLTTGSFAITPFGTKRRLIITGSNYNTSFANIFDPQSGCVYNEMRDVRLPKARLGFVTNHPRFPGQVWAGGYFDYRSVYQFAIKIEERMQIRCHPGETDYLGRGCYAPILAKDCFGLCAKCFIRNDQNACAEPTALAYARAISLFAGRCATPGQHYNSVTHLCDTVGNKRCHPLCGGECLFPLDSTRCAHHCVGSRTSTTLIWPTTSASASPGPSTA